MTSRRRSLGKALLWISSRVGASVGRAGWRDTDMLLVGGMVFMGSFRIRGMMVGLGLRILRGVILREYSV